MREHGNRMLAALLAPLALLMPACIEDDALPDLPPLPSEDGMVDGMSDGMVDGTPDGSRDATADDSPPADGLDDGIDRGAGDGEADPVDGTSPDLPDMRPIRCAPTEAGEVDGGPCTVGVGACAAEGAWLCDFSGEWRCDGVPGEAGAEVCNGLDDDCNGAVDDVSGLEAVCVLGEGRCAFTGLALCDLDAGELACRAVEPALEPIDETCNGVDDDCDGHTDEALPGVGDPCEVGVGGCNGVGRRVCRAEAGGGVDEALVCDAIGGEPGAEQCNGLDDDCDGGVDEGLGGGGCQTGQAGACAAGTLRCENGREVCARNVAPGLERCDGAIDEDCDGRLDEAPLNACGQCAPAPAELCNGLDDDCDGAVDERLFRCGLDMACNRDKWIIRSGDAGMLPVQQLANFPGSTLGIVAVEDYYPAGDEDFEYRLDPAASITYSAGRGGANAYVGVRVCSIGYGGTAGVTVRERALAGDGHVEIDLPEPVVAGPAQDSVAFPLVWEYTTGGDNDVWYDATVTNPGGAGRGALTTYAGDAGTRVSAAYYLIRAARMRLESTAFDVRADVDGWTFVDVAPPAGHRRWGQPIISIGRMQPGAPGGDPDNDMWFRSECFASGAGWRCQIDAGAAERDVAAVGGQIITIWAAN